MRLFGLSGEWDEETYSALLDVVIAHGGYCLLAVRKDASDECLSWIQARSTDLESKAETMQWPGTVVYDESEQASLLKFPVTSELVEALRSVTRSLFEWLGPDLPEDLSFLRQDGRPWFVSIAHEKAAFFKLTDDEVDLLGHQLGGAKLVAQGDDQAPGESY